jgi:hypothetical protein
MCTIIKNQYFQGINPAHIPCVYYTHKVLILAKIENGLELLHLIKLY